jgi:molybdopterin molybdotransferase
MTSVEMATQIILDAAGYFGNEQVSLEQCEGRVLAEDLTADRDFPPFDRVTMDGIAIDFESWSVGCRSFKIENLQPAGAPQMVLMKKEDCLEVMTGAILPQKTDTVVRYEDVTMEDGFAHINNDLVIKGQNIHVAGSDRKRKEVLVGIGRTLSSAEVGIAATIGKTEVCVRRLPRTIVFSTGDELVEVSETPLPHQIRKSNLFTIIAELSGWGIRATSGHLNDDRQDVESKIKEALSSYDAVILSGGVSEGKLDFVPGALESLGVEKLFHKVSQRPGKPFWFGKSKNGAVVFALPGNPVSTFMCLHRYFLPWLRMSLSLLPFRKEVAVLHSDFNFKPPLTHFLQVKLFWSDTGQQMALPLAGGGSGDLTNLVDTDAFMELPLEKEFFKAGEVFPVFRFR